jgi:flagellar basal-body rod protein FlgB
MSCLRVLFKAEMNGTIFALKTKHTLGKGIRMPSSNLFGGSINILEKAMNLRATQHNVLSANVANMDTPHYKAFEVHVEEALQTQNADPQRLPMAQTHSGHLPLRQIGQGNLVIQSETPPELSLRADGNTVDIDQTMGKMAENTIKFKTAAQLIATKFKGLRKAIQGGN